MSQLGENMSGLLGTDNQVQRLRSSHGRDSGRGQSSSVSKMSTAERTMMAYVEEYTRGMLNIDALLTKLKDRRPI